MIGRRTCAQADELAAIVRGVQELSQQFRPAGASGEALLSDEAAGAVLAEFSRRIEAKRAALDDVGERIVWAALSFEQTEAENTQLAQALLRRML